LSKFLEQTVSNGLHYVVGNMTATEHNDFHWLLQIYLQAIKFFNCNLLLIKCWQYDNMTRIVVEDMLSSICQNSQEFEFHWVQRDKYNDISPCPEFVKIGCCNVFSNMLANILHLTVWDYSYSKVFSQLKRNKPFIKIQMFFLQLK